MFETEGVQGAIPVPVEGRPEEQTLLPGNRGVPGVVSLGGIMEVRSLYLRDDAAAAAQTPPTAAPAQRHQPAPEEDWIRENENWI